MKLKIHGSLRSLLAAFGGYWHFVLLALSRYWLASLAAECLRALVATEGRE